MSSERLAVVTHEAGQQPVVGMDVGEVAPPALGLLQHQVQAGTRIHATRFVKEVDPGIGEGRHHLGRFIGGVVEDPQLPAGVLLFQYALHSFADEVGLVVRRHEELEGHGHGRLVSRDWSIGGGAEDMG